MSGDIILAVLGSGGLFTLIQVLLNRLWQKNDKKKAENDAMTKMVLAIGRKDLIELCKEYEKLGYVPDDEYEMLIELGNAYLELGGNSKVKKHYEIAKELPIREE